MLFKKIAILFTISLLTGCGLFAYERLAAYDLTVQVRDSKGLPVSGVVVKSTNNQKVVTGRRGEAVLVYTTGGLHVVTVQSRYAATQQIKVNVPMVEQNQITVYLEDTRLAEPKGKVMRQQFVEQ